MSSPTLTDGATDPAVAPASRPSSAPRLLTWISTSGRVIEQVRIVTRGERMRARGSVVAAAGDDEHGVHPAFTLTYEVEVDVDGRPRRIALTSSPLEGERTLELVHDGTDGWLQGDATGSRTRLGEPGVVDVDVTFSAFFASLIIRANELHSQQGEFSRTALSVDGVSLKVSSDVVTFTSDEDRVHGITGTASTSATVDADGFIVDVAGLTRRG